jgi:hypothetical protein
MISHEYIKIEQEALISALPQHCPACMDIDETEWSEYSISLSEIFYLNTADKERRIYRGASLSAECTRCATTFLSHQETDTTKTNPLPEEL